MKTRCSFHGAQYRNRMAQPVLKILCALALALVATPLSTQRAAAENAHARIINGQPTAGAWPWMVSIGAAGVSPGRGHFCGGTLIDSRFVLTAAHCVFDVAATPESIQLMIGRTRITDESGVIVPADGVIIHPGFNPETLLNDIALVRLAQPVSGFTPLPLLSAEEEQQLAPDVRARLLGWGTTDANYPIRPTTLHEANIPVISSEQCQDRLGIDFDPTSMLCAGVLSSAPERGDGIDACYGDSGGPLMVETAGGWRLIGLTSWGLSCASDRFWGVYTRASTFRGWAYSARTIPPYVIAPPIINGTPRVGARLSCEAGLYGGDAPELMQVMLRDAETGRYVSKTGSYALRKSDIGRTLVCEVMRMNGAGAVSVESEPVGPVFPKQASGRLTVRGTATVSEASIRCLRASCSIVLSFRKPLSKVQALLPGRAHWINAQRVSNTTWSFPLKRKENLEQVFFRATILDRKESFSFEGRLAQGKR